MCFLRTTLLWEMEECVRVTKEVMGEKKEWNYENKEEDVEFGMKEYENIRLLGGWVGDRMDIKTDYGGVNGFGLEWKDNCKVRFVVKEVQTRMAEAYVARLLYEGMLKV